MSPSLKAVSFFLAAALLQSGCAMQDGNSAASAPVVASSLPDGLQVISAVYGSGTQFADVTARVDKLLAQSEPEFYARPEWLHADPTPGWNKALVIVYQIKGKRYTFTTGEAGKVTPEILLENTDK